MAPTTAELLKKRGSGEARGVGRDGDDIPPEGLADGVDLTIEPDGGPIYLVGDISVSSVE